MMRAHEFRASVAGARRGAALGQSRRRMLPTTAVALEAIARLAERDADTTAALTKLARQRDPDATDVANAQERYAELAHQLARRIDESARDPALMHRILIESRTESRERDLAYLSTAIITGGTVILFALAGWITGEAPAAILGAGIAAYVIAAIAFAALARLRRRAFVHDLATLADPEVPG